MVWFGFGLTWVLGRIRHSSQVSFDWVFIGFGVGGCWRGGSGTKHLVLRWWFLPPTTSLRLCTCSRFVVFCQAQQDSGVLKFIGYALPRSYHRLRAFPFSIAYRAPPELTCLILAWACLGPFWKRSVDRTTGFCLESRPCLALLCLAMPGVVRPSHTVINFACFLPLPVLDRRALYTVVFDLRHVSRDDIDERVQFWVDCVQSRWVR